MGIVWSFCFWTFAVGQHVVEYGETLPKCEAIYAATDSCEDSILCYRGTIYLLIYFECLTGSIDWQTEDDEEMRNLISCRCHRQKVLEVLVQVLLIRVR